MLDSRIYDDSKLKYQSAHQFSIFLIEQMNLEEKDQLDT